MLGLADCVEVFAAAVALVQRRIVDTKPIQSIYSLTEKGKTIAKQLNQIQQNIK